MGFKITYEMNKPILYRRWSCENRFAGLYVFRRLDSGLHLRASSWWSVRPSHPFLNKCCFLLLLLLGFGAFSQPPVHDCSLLLPWPYLPWKVKHRLRLHARTHPREVLNSCGNFDAYHGWRHHFDHYHLLPLHLQILGRLLNLWAVLDLRVYCGYLHRARVS